MKSQNNMKFYYFEVEKVQTLGFPFAIENDRELTMYIFSPMFGLDELVTAMTTEPF